MRLKSQYLAAALALYVGAAMAGEPSPEKFDSFAIQLYRQIGGNAGNLFFSPLSVHSALAMVYAGSAGDTAQQLQNVLQYSAPPDQFGDSYLSFLKAISTAPKIKNPGGGEEAAYELSIANALWGQKDYEFRPEYLAQVQEKYLGRMTSVDFADTEPTRLKINGWVEEQTKQKIKNLIPSGAIDRSTLLVLTNAIYFKGSWQTQFSESATQDSPFTLMDGSTVNTPLMRHSAHFSYASVAGAHVLVLPYRGGHLEMTVFCPTKVDGLAELEKSLTPEILSPAMRPKRITLNMPKFKMEYSTRLASELKKLGVTDAFSGGTANFSRMTSHNDLALSEVLHKAFIDVDEHGTEAAAATAAIMVRSAARADEEEPLEVSIDRPFLFLIRHRATGAILFMGRVTNPRG